jgi:D-methionine transport system ATP-binding protein
VGRIKETPYGQLIVAVGGSASDLTALEPALAKAGVHCEVLRP